MATPGGLVDKQELIDAQLDTAHLGRVVNSKDASGAPINTSTNRTGGVNKTLDALEAEYLEAIRNAGGEPLNGGVWAAGQTFTAYNQFMVYNDIAYKPRTTTTLPYGPTGVAPDTNFVGPFSELSITNLGTYVDYSFDTVVELQAAEYMSIGDKASITNRGRGVFVKETGGSPNGFDVIALNDGNTARLVTRPASSGNIGLFPSGSDQSDALIALSGINSGSSFLSPGNYVFNSGDFAGVPFHSDGSVTTTNPSVAVVDVSIGKNAKFNKAPSYDRDAGKPLTLSSDENLGGIRRVSYKLPDQVMGDASPSVNLRLANGVVIPKFRVKADISGDNFAVRINTQTQSTRDTSVAEVLNTGEISTPTAGFIGRSQNYVEMTKGVGAGVVKISYQYQDPLTKVRSNVPVWVIDLDDGKAPYFYKFLFPECSGSTMNGFKKLSNAPALSWIIEAVEGPVSITAKGKNLSDSIKDTVFLRTVSPADESGKFISPYYTGFDINFIEVIISQNSPGSSFTLTNLEIEVE
ncbi:hypothetical protein NVP1104O_93, partial [Vibrio phage 1.104.O._10N.286.49.A12]